MRRVAAAAAVLVAVMASPAAAQSLGGDSVSGTVTLTSTPSGTAELVFGASSGPAGENPTGVVTAAFLDFGVFLEFQVTCMSVNGNAATVGARYFDRPLGEQLIYFQIVDGGPGAADRIGSIATGSAFDCARPPLPFVATNTIASGDLVVVDAPGLPTSSKECKKGGWRHFGAFKNQGDCVSSVATSGKKSSAGRPAR
jgi:hypothetical protein